jgi:hypothetical protein
MIANNYMKMIMKKGIQFFLIAAGIGILVSGCTDTKSDIDKAEIQFFLTDMPGEYQQVNIDLVSIKVIMNDSLLELPTYQGVYNLLDFVNGKDTLLVDDEVPAGFISQIRLILGENNTIMRDGVLYDLKTPSAQQSGLKLNVHYEVLPGESYAYIIDFVVEKSIVETGNGKFILKPVIHVYTESITGSIQGVVSPVEARPYIMAIREKDTTTTYADTLSGNFMIRGLPEGAYNLEIQPIDGFSDTTLSDVMVVNGQTTILDSIMIK